MKPALAFPLRLGPATRVSLGLVAMMLSLLLLSDLFVPGFLPDRQDDARRQRLLAAELIATQVSRALSDHRDDDLPAMLKASIRGNGELRSAAVVTDAGTMAAAGDPAQSWRLPAAAESTLDNLRVPLFTHERRWGELQLAFAPWAPQAAAQWLVTPIVLGLLLTLSLGFVAFQLYLRRAMRYLDPSAAVPERVRTAFDMLVEAVLVLDTDGRIMLANKTFENLRPEEESIGALVGSNVSELAWFTRGIPQEIGLPWQAVLKTNRPILGIEMRVAGRAGARQAGRREVVMNCTSINDGFRRARGCLLTLTDVTELHERTEGLRVALVELQASKEEIRLKNEELTLLATRDALTGCLNRRAFLAESERAISAAQAAKLPLCAIMCDVDHFKSINDRFGHGGGDEVLKAVSKALARGLRSGDLLGRYGGEEFCVVLPDATLEQALEVAERLRSEVEANAGSAVRQFAEVKVTMSFGVEQLGPEAAQFSTLIDRADQALYRSTQSGRNRVTAWRDMQDAAVS